MGIGSGQGGEKNAGVTQFEVTPEMIDAGVAELREKMFGQNLRDVVLDVFWVMLAARTQTSLLAEANKDS